MFDRVLGDVPRRRRGPGEGDPVDPVDLVDVVLGQESVGDEATVVWDAALALSYALVHNQDHLKLGDKKRVLELGAGTGAVGIVAAVLG